MRMNWPTAGQEGEMNLRELLKRAGGTWEADGLNVIIPHPKKPGMRMTAITVEDYEGEGPTRAALIVALHNCAEELLSVVEAAENYTEHGYFMGGPPVQDDYDQLCAALLRYREKEKTCR